MFPKILKFSVRQTYFSLPVGIFVCTRLRNCIIKQGRIKTIPQPQNKRLTLITQNVTLVTLNYVDRGVSLEPGRLFSFPQPRSYCRHFESGIFIRARVDRQLKLFRFDSIAVAKYLYNLSHQPHLRLPRQKMAANRVRGF